MKNDLVSILIDNREPEWVQELDFAAPKQVALLPAGDAMVATTDNQILLIERKTPEDFLASIRDGRLLNQALAMREQTPWAYLVITGPLIPDGEGWVNGTGWRYESVQGALLSVQEVGVNVIYCDGNQDYVPCILRLVHRDRGDVRVSPARVASVYSEGQALLSSLPGVGPEKALTLLKELPSVAWALVYLASDHDWNDKPIPGIGMGTKAKVRSALGLDEGFVLEIAAVNGDCNE